MSKIALLIAFQYCDEQLNRSFLPGTVIDLYRMFKLVRDRGYDEVVIVSDIRMSPKLAFETLSIQGVNDDIVHLNDYITAFESKSQLLPLIAKAVTSKFGFIYYSGHSVGSKLLLPGVEYISDVDLYTAMGSANANVQTILIFDCCHGHNFMLPYIYNNGVYRLVDGARVYFTQQVISICASSYDQVSYSDVSGSLLTTSLDRFFHDHSDQSGIGELERFLTHDIMSSAKSCPQIYTSYPDIHNLWPWFLTNLKWNVHYDSYAGNVTCQLDH